MNAKTTRKAWPANNNTSWKLTWIYLRGQKVFHPEKSGD